jgi:hypothetical protein
VGKIIFDSNDKKKRGQRGVVCDGYIHLGFRKASRGLLALDCPGFFLTSVRCFCISSSYFSWIIYGSAFFVLLVLHFYLHHQHHIHLFFFHLPICLSGLFLHCLGGIFGGDCLSFFLYSLLLSGRISGAFRNTRIHSSFPSGDPSSPPSAASNHLLCLKSEALSLSYVSRR